MHAGPLVHARAGLGTGVQRCQAVAFLEVTIPCHPLSFFKQQDPWADVFLWAPPGPAELFPESRASVTGSTCLG